MQRSLLLRRERSIYLELLSRFDGLTDGQLRIVGVTRDWSAKDLLAQLAYWERATAGQIRDFETGAWPPRINSHEGASNQLTSHSR
jgi:hypothetical protein